MRDLTGRIGRKSEMRDVRMENLWKRKDMEDRRKIERDIGVRL